MRPGSIPREVRFFKKKHLIYGQKQKFDNDEFSITRVRVRYRVNFRSQKLRSSYKTKTTKMTCH